MGTRRHRRFLLGYLQAFQTRFVHVLEFLEACTVLDPSPTAKKWNKVHYVRFFKVIARYVPKLFSSTANQHSVHLGPVAWFTECPEGAGRAKDETLPRYFCRIRRFKRFGDFPEWALRLLSILPTSVLVEQHFSQRNKLVSESKSHKRDAVTDAEMVLVTHVRDVDR